MRNLLHRLWHEETGTVFGAEWALITTVLVLAAITCVVASRPVAATLEADDPPAAVQRR
jgi:hypothetical protein